MQVAKRKVGSQALPVDTVPTCSPKIFGAQAQSNTETQRYEAATTKSKAILPVPKALLPVPPKKKMPAPPKKPPPAHLLAQRPPKMTPPKTAPPKMTPPKTAPPKMTPPKTAPPKQRPPSRSMPMGASENPQDASEPSADVTRF